MASETTAAATGEVGIVRRDPMAMKPFCGYNFGEYWSHWLSMASRGTHLPRIFHVNWFRRDAEGKFLWPGYGENLRVLEWIIRRCEGKAEAVDTGIGLLPTAAAINREGLEVTSETLDALLRVDADSWQSEMDFVEEYLDAFNEDTPHALRSELAAVRKRLSEPAGR